MHTIFKGSLTKGGDKMRPRASFCSNIDVYKSCNFNRSGDELDTPDLLPGFLKELYTGGLIFVRRSDVLSRVEAESVN